MQVNRIISFRDKDCSSPIFALMTFNQIDDIIYSSLQRHAVAKDMSDFIREFGFQDTETICTDTTLVTINKDTKFYIISIPFSTYELYSTQEQVKATIDNYFYTIRNQEPTEENIKADYSFNEMIDANNINISMYDSNYKLKETSNIKHIFPVLETVICDICTSKMGEWNRYHDEVGYYLANMIKWIKKLKWVPIFEYYADEEEYHNILRMLEEKLRVFMEGMRECGKHCSYSKYCEDDDGHIILDKYHALLDNTAFPNEYDYMKYTYGLILLNAPIRDRDKYEKAFLLQFIFTSETLSYLLFNGYIENGIHMPCDMNCFTRCNTTTIQYKFIYDELSRFLRKKGLWITDDPE